MDMEQGLYSYHPASFPQQTFPTPSELLRGLAAQDTDASTPDAYAAAIAKIHKPESTRKARQRAMAESIGYTPTDPDSISSHEKKRHYLECLEHYVAYLHEQLGLVGSTPAALERVLTPGRGLSSRSIRFLDLRERASIELGIQVEDDISVYPTSPGYTLGPGVVDASMPVHAAGNGSSMHPVGADGAAMFGATDRDMIPRAMSIDIPRAIAVPANPMASYASAADPEIALQAGAAGVPVPYTQP
ncbi:hypothetical protein HGRIS_007838 [Hohenbuehelia grisea]|uniref:Uncharacterized protein n=1 Tax=Hohenbuehelia grisea TaxID=104357 RepID=A0ABR3J6V5_9AGAR